MDRYLRCVYDYTIDILSISLNTPCMKIIFNKSVVTQSELIS